jgi:uncharacterized protein YdhG (YjbR/CyaY superfamily)
MRARPRTVDEYLARLPDAQRAALQSLRRTIQRAAPRAEERLSYGICAFRLDGMLVGFGAVRTHCALYLMIGRAVTDHAAALAGYDTSKGTVRFVPSAPLPDALVRRLVKARIAENREVPAPAGVRARSRAPGRPAAGARPKESRRKERP